MKTIWLHVLEKLIKEKKQNKKTLISLYNTLVAVMIMWEMIYEGVAKMWNGKRNKWKSTILIY